MSLEITGTLRVKYDTQTVNERFKKREFVLETTEEVNGNIYSNYAKMQLVQNKCELLDRFNEGQQVKVSFNIKGNKWEKDGKVNYMTNLDAWRIEAEGSQPTQANQAIQEAVASPYQTGVQGGGSIDNTKDDLPF